MVKKKALTLIELLVAMAVVLLIAIAVILFVSYKANKQEEAPASTNTTQEDTNPSNEN